MDNVEIEEPQRTQKGVSSVNPGAQRAVPAHPAPDIRGPKYCAAQGFRMNLHSTHKSVPMLLSFIVGLKLALKLLHDLLFLAFVFAFVGEERRWQCAGSLRQRNAIPKLLGLVIRITKVRDASGQASPTGIAWLGRLPSLSTHSYDKAAAAHPSVCSSLLHYPSISKPRKLAADQSRCTQP